MKLAGQQFSSARTFREIRKKIIIQILVWFDHYQTYPPNPIQFQITFLYNCRSILKIIIRKSGDHKPIKNGAVSVAPCVTAVDPQ